MRSFIILTGWLACTWIGVQAQTFPAGFSRVTVGGTSPTPAIANPTTMAFLPDGRILVCQQNGSVRVIKNDVLLTTPFVSITVDATGERGLIGIAIDPDFTTNNYVYLYYTVPAAPIHNRISRFTANGDVAVVGSEQLVLDLDNLSTATNHNGGAMAFGPDGKLYVAVGENALGTNAPNLNTYHGKILRINKDGSIPAGNPFTGGSEQRQRIWSLGLRNPYTIAFQPGTGKFFVNDVGQDVAEEVNDATLGGRNFGWPATEGATTNPSYVAPVYAYLHAGPLPNVCAITGGTFFNPPATNYPSNFIGKYFILDLCGAWIYSFDPNEASPTATQFGTNVGNQSLGLTTGPDGNLYYLSRSSQRLFRVVYTPPASAPVITAHPQSISVFVGQMASFSVTATGSPAPTYQWQRSNVNIAGATSATYVITSAQPGDAGEYRVVVTNANGTVTSTAATLTVAPATLSPQITTHPVNVSVIEGASATFSVTATGTAPLLYQWQRNNINIVGATGTQYTIPSTVKADEATYRVLVDNSSGQAVSNGAALAVNRRPVAAITTPVEGILFTAGTTYDFAGTGTDPDDGVLPASAFEWAINFHHETHRHDQPVITGVKAGIFSVPNRGETSPNVWYRIILAVKDQQGIVAYDSVDMLPITSQMTFTTNPAGLSFTLDGQPFTGPHSVTGVAGILRDIAATEPQTLANVSYQFESWSNAGAASQTVTTPTSNTTYVATFTPVVSVNDTELAITGFPQPARDKFHLQANGIITVDVIDMMGKRVTVDIAYEEKMAIIPVAGLSEGIYILQYTLSSGSGRMKMLVAR